MRRARTSAVHAVLLVALVAAVGLAVSLGSVPVPVDQVGRILLDPLLFWTGPAESPGLAAIVWESRMPRVAAALVVGASLALAGGVAQLVTANPMADPYLLGVSQGAGLAVSVLVVFGVGAGLLGAATQPVAAFLGGLAALLAVLLVTGRSGSATKLVLGGLAVGQVASALTSLVLHTSPSGDHAVQVLFWITGGLGAVRWESLAFPAAALGVGALAALVTARRLNVLRSGDDAAAALGVDPRVLRTLALVGISLLAGTSVAVAGGIGFVGLLVPHAAAFLVGSEARRMLSVSALLGAVFLVVADLVARLAVAPSELPVGVLTALVGGPLFLSMLWRRRSVG
ncbi:iron ABC transporter permease [Saccharopolyspora sp. HNM0983]|uniref:Iron ABC transporter permease n=1 Tax=Saccharopolyspora montiporae TaxID=2781240 RepID=A0A929FZR4_9PSEU|nr:iron ABC transporter permease [Saccharopolyspora sp. HNM0983]MBE9374017.1 iron ABC transporter permease [Saccharopolyspora sp. HNM0983]